MDDENLIYSRDEETAWPPIGAAVVVAVLAFYCATRVGVVFSLFTDLVEALGGGFSGVSPVFDFAGPFIRIVLAAIAAIGLFTSFRARSVYAAIAAVILCSDASFLLDILYFDIFIGTYQTVSAPTIHGSYNVVAMLSSAYLILSRAVKTRFGTPFPAVLPF